MADQQSQLRIRFRQAREDAQLSQEDAAERLGISVASMSRKELGKQAVKLRDVVTMERIRDDLAAARLVIMRDDALSAHDRADAYVIPAWIGQRIVDFDRELARVGVTNEKLDHILTVLRSEPTISRVLTDSNGNSRPMPEQERELGLMMQAMRFWAEQSSVVGTIQPDMPPDAVIEPARPAARNTAAKSSEVESASRKGKGQ